MAEEIRNLRSCLADLQHIAGCTHGCVKPVTENGTKFQLFRFSGMVLFRSFPDKNQIVRPGAGLRVLLRVSRKMQRKCRLRWTDQLAWVEEENGRLGLMFMRKNSPRFVAFSELPQFLVMEVGWGN